MPLGLLHRSNSMHPAGALSLTSTQFPSSVMPHGLCRSKGQAPQAQGTDLATSKRYPVTGAPPSNEGGSQLTQSSVCMEKGEGRQEGRGGQNIKLLAVFSSHRVRGLLIGRPHGEDWTAVCVCVFLAWEGVGAASCVHAAGLTGEADTSLGASCTSGTLGGVAKSTGLQKRPQPEGPCALTRALYEQPGLSEAMAQALARSLKTAYHSRPMWSWAAAQRACSWTCAMHGAARAGVWQGFGGGRLEKRRRRGERREGNEREEVERGRGGRGGYVAAAHAWACGARALVEGAPSSLTS
jgi:hypothetical protein